MAEQKKVHTSSDNHWLRRSGQISQVIPSGDLHSGRHALVLGECGRDAEYDVCVVDTSQPLSRRKSVRPSPLVPRHTDGLMGSRAKTALLLLEQ
jgi:hypothetical protein